MRNLDAILEAVRPQLEVHEETRLRLMAQRIEVAKQIALTVVAILGVAWVVGFVASQVTGEPLPLERYALGLAAIVAAVMFYVQIVVPTRAFRSDFKRDVVGTIVGTMEPNVTFTPDRGVAFAEFEKSRLFGRKPDRYRCEDGLKGEIGDTSVHISEIHAEEERTRRDSKGNRQTYYETIFDGVFMVADFHKHFRGTARVLPDKAEKLLGGLGKALQDFRPFQTEDLVYLEDPEFESEFVVYGSDQIEARYLLTTSMLRRIVELKQKWKSDVRLSFADGKVYLAIAHRGDLLEPSIEQSVLSRASIARIVADLVVCFDLVDDLNLNTRIWSKE